MKLHTGWSMSSEVRRWAAAVLAFVLVITSFTGLANAAEETITGIEFEYDESDYNNSTSSLEMNVEDEKVNVTVLAAISGASSKKDVTSAAVWKTSNSDIVKVDKGVLTGVGSGTATISATYSGYTVSVKASSSFIYDEVILMQDGSPAEATIPDIKLGESLAFTLDGKKNGVTTTITSDAIWTTSSSAVARVDEGVITLTGTGTATITAKFKGKSDSIKITVTSPYKSIAFSPAIPNDLLELYVGTDDRELRAIASPKTGGTIDVTEDATWTSGNSKLLTVEDGVLTAVAPGKTTLTVSHLGATTKVDVVVRTPYQAIKLSPEKEYHMQLQDAPLQIKAEVLNNANVEATVTDLADWTSSDVMVATVSKGKVTPKAVGTARITASYKGVSRSIDITVYPSISKLSVETARIDGFIGIEGDLPKVTAKTFDGSSVDVTKLVEWASEDEDIASIKNNKWKAHELGTTNLTATVQGKKVEVELTVHVKPLKLIADEKEMSLIIGKAVDLPAVTVVNENGEEEDVTASVKWQASSDNIVITSETMKGLEASTVTLTGTYLTKTVKVRVKIEEEIVKFVVAPAELELNPGRSKAIKVTGYYKNGKSVSIASKMNWRTGDSSVAVISGSSSIKAVDVGKTKAIGSYQGKTIEISVQVTPKLKSLQASTKSLALGIGETQTVKLQANYTTGSPVDQTLGAVWTTSKASVATVKDGKITAVGKGTATIKASFGGKTATVRVTVK